jgi:hypothetical protein
MCMDIRSGYMVELDMDGVNVGNGKNLIPFLLLENISLFWNLETPAREHGYLIHLFFSDGHRSTHCFKYLRHLSIF